MPEGHGEGIVQTPNAAFAAAAKAVAGKKIRRSQGHTGSIPVASTILYKLSGSIVQIAWKQKHCHYTVLGQQQ